MNYPLVRDTIDSEDVDHLIKWLSSYPRLTKGPVTKEFELAWANWIGTKHAVYVNSGSSANLLMLYTLILQNKLKPGDKVVIPAISWATDLAPVIQLGLTPVLCDCNLENLSVDVDDLLRICKQEKPKALILVSVLGLVPSMDDILQICNDNQVILIEDVCESLGSKYRSKKLGTFGVMSSFSLYFGHHISTIEGGFVCTDDDDLMNLLVSIRNHGWDRDWSIEVQAEIRKKHQVNEFDALYTFYYPGFNFRSTDLQAILGLRQLNKLDKICEIREENFKRYVERLSVLDFWTPAYNIENTFISNFCFPIIHEHRHKIFESLKDAGVESRPLICGSMGTQPMYYERFGKLYLKNASRIDMHGMYVPNNQQMTVNDVDNIANVIIEAIKDK